MVRAARADLAGLGLTFDQFKHQVRQSWGIMPRWSEQQIPDKELANVYAFLTSLPRVATPGVAPPGVPPDISNRRVGEGNIGRPSRVTAPPNAPLGQRYAVNLAGCAQCHGPEQRSSREEMGSRTHPRYNGRDLAQLVKDTTGFTGSEEAVTWEYFKACVYDHEKLVPDARMGTYSRARLPEPVVREIYNFAISLGTRARLVNELAPGVRSGDTVSYTLTVTNLGKKHGMQPEDVSVELVLDQGVNVVRAMGNGYQGVQRHPLSGRDVAVWKTDDQGGRAAELHAGCQRPKGGPGASHDCPAGSLEPDVGSPRSRGSLESPLGETDHARISQHGKGCTQAA